MSIRLSAIFALKKKQKKRFILLGVLFHFW